MSSYLRFASREWPFIGLRPFQHEDRDFLFGREKELDLLEPRVTRKRFVAIVGSSGCGKSSLIRAGLRPRLEKVDDRRWRWIEMRPADAPVRELALALANLTGETGYLLEACADRFERVLSRSSLGIAEASRSISQQSKTDRILLLVDQFEELFRFASLRSEDSLDPATAAERRDEATAFVRLLLAATKAPEVPVHVVVTMRSDFIGDCARFHDLPEAVSGSQFLVPGMTRDQREDVIRKPLKLAGGEIDPDLVQSALNATNEDPDQLPILQHAMMRCWERALDRYRQKLDRRPHLTISDYAAVGGVAHALSVHANEILAALAGQPDPTGIGVQLATKRIFQALTETDQEGRSVRRPQRFRALVQYVKPNNASEDAAREVTGTVIARFASHDCSFLRIPDVGIADNSIIDIGHEALIRRWDKLKGEGQENWIHEEERDAEQYRALVRYAENNSTIPPKDLVRMEDWWSKRMPNSFWAQRYTKHDSANFQKIPKLLAESRAEANRAIEEQQRNESRVITIVADAIRNPRLYNGAADSLATALDNKLRGLPTVTEYVELLYNGLGDLRERRRIEIPDGFPKQIFNLSFAPAGELFAVAVPGNLLFFDSNTGKFIHSEAIPPGWTMSLRWSPDGRRIYIGTSPVGRILAACFIQQLRKYFTESGKDNWDLWVDIGSEEYPAGAGAWSHDGGYIVVAAWQRRASVWDTAKGQFKQLISDNRLESNPLDYLCSGDLTASADGELIALGAASGKIHIFNAHSGGQDEFSLKLNKSLDPLDSTKSPPYSLVFDPQNHDRLLAAYMVDFRMALWKVDENVPIATFGDQESGPVWRVGFDPEGEFVLSATNDAVVRLWTSPDPDSAVKLRGHRDFVLSLGVNPENGNIASASFDGTIRLWAKDSPLSPTLLSSSPSIPSPTQFTVQNGRISVTADSSKNDSWVLPEDFGETSAAAVSANGAGVAVVPRSGRPLLFVKLRDLEPARVTLFGVKAEWTAVAFIENDTRIAAKTKEGKVFSWPFYSDVHALEQLANEYLPSVRDANGSEKRLPGFMFPQVARAFGG